MPFIWTMQKRFLKLNPDYQHCDTFMGLLPKLFDEETNVIHNGRNTIKCIKFGGQTFVVKRYKRPFWFQRIIYTFFRKSKAQRSYENAMQLRKRGFVTPHEVAYMEERHLGLLQQAYYVCEYTSAQSIRERLIEQNPFDESLATAYAHFVAQLHEAGVLHRDLNPTNVLYRKRGEDYDFELIDINRMHFYEKSVPKVECMENLTLFWWFTDVYRFILCKYAAFRGWSEADMEKAVSVKKWHDRVWVCRKRIIHPFRK